MPLVIGGLAVVALDVARRIFRMTQLFNPSRDPVSTWNPEDYGIPHQQCEEVWMETGDGELLYGWYLRAKKPVASALYCHGNTGNLTNPAHLMPHLLDSGINILLFDYRGYGRSTGTATMSGVVADTLAAARYHETIRPKNLPTILYGFSLGGAIAAQVIRRHPFDGLILQSTFTTLSDVAKIAFPRLPVHLMSGTGFDTLRAIRDLDVPLLILHGTEDPACPCWMADALYEACAASKKILRVNGGLHKDLWQRDTRGMLDAVRTFAQELPRTAQPIDIPHRFSALRWMRRWVRHVIASAAARHAGRRQVLSC
ncbi:MAG: lysophospholipase [Acidobacteriota bacterium]|nr:lysophospholipase [Acidobacteriota bacterium]